jgi:hypothetical protein
VIPGFITCSLFGFLGQSLLNKVQQRNADRKPTARDNTNILQRIANSRFTPVKSLSNEEYEDMLKEKLIRIEADIALIDEDLALLRTQEAARQHDEEG